MDHNSPVATPDWVRISNGKASRSGRLIADTAGGDAAAVYRALGCSYPKFFKMDSLSKWAWLAAEALLHDPQGAWVYEGLDKRHIAVVIHTTDGCLEVDKRYAETLKTVPSPALFVYTLPNIMLGEICIRHGFTGPQLCQVSEYFEAEELLVHVTDLLEHRGATHCLFGKADAVGDLHEVCLVWTDAAGIRSLNASSLQALYQHPL